MNSNSSSVDQSACDMGTGRTVELLTCELEHDDLVAFVERCKADGVSVGDKLTQLIQFFLAGGDNHLLKQSA